jgi:hypothetical protein
MAMTHEAIATPAACPGSPLSPPQMRLDASKPIPEGFIVARKVQIPEGWLKFKPSLSRMPYVYNIDQAVGINCPNCLDDVMLVQFMLRTWEYTTNAGIVSVPRRRISSNLSVGGKADYGDIPVNGKYDLPTLGFMLMFQLKQSTSWGNGPVNGRFDPIDLDKQGEVTDSSMIMLNSILKAYASQSFRDLSVAPGIPARLNQLLKGFA